MLVEDRLFDQEWVQELGNAEFRMLMYLMRYASKKCGIVELNMRMLNYAANTKRQFTKEEVLCAFAKVLTPIPGQEDAAIFHNWIAVNWARGDKPMDFERNPLYKSIANELSSYGLTMAKVNAMASAKVNVAQPSLKSGKTAEAAVAAVAETVGMFAKFWAAYPDSCPRKVDKAKCLAKFCAVITKARDRDALFKEIMDGLERWKVCATWTKDGGQYIRAPLVWLNNMNWKDDPGGANGNSKGSANSNFKSADVAGLF